MENFLFAGAYLRQSGDNRFRQVIGVGGGADLVKDDVQAFPFGTELAHGLDKVAAVGRIEPGGSNDDSGIGVV